MEVMYEINTVQGKPEKAIYSAILMILEKSEAKWQVISHAQ